jgi:hypothetical protein
MHPKIEFGAAVQVRLKGPVFSSLENWRRAQEEIPPRSEAIRRLVELALGIEQRRPTPDNTLAPTPDEQRTIKPWA